MTRRNDKRCGLYRMRALVLWVRVHSGHVAVVSYRDIGVAGEEGHVVGVDLLVAEYSEEESMVGRLVLEVSLKVSGYLVVEDFFQEACSIVEGESLDEGGSRDEASKEWAEGVLVSTQ